MLRLLMMKKLAFNAKDSTIGVVMRRKVPTTKSVAMRHVFS